jgi:hypothetical protein
MENEGNSDGDPDLAEWPGEDAGDVERMIDLLNEYACFLRECGGCKVDGFESGD